MHKSRRRDGSTDNQESGAGLTLTDSGAVVADARVELAGQPVAAVHRAVVDGLGDDLVRAARDALTSRTPAKARRWLDENVTALGGHYADAAMSAGRGEWTGVRGLLRLTPALGTGNTPADLRTSTDDLTTSYTPLLAAADVTPTVVVRLTPEFREQRAGQRREICAYLAALATGCDVRVVGSSLDLRWLAHAHADDLPSVREQYDPRREDTPTAERVADAADALAPDDSEVAVLEALADEPTGTLGYDTLTRRFSTHSAASVRRWIGTLRELGLVATYGQRGSKTATLTDAGETFLTDEIARQQTLQNCVRESRQTTHDPVYPEASTGGGTAPTADRDRTADRAAVRFLPLAEHLPPAETAPDGGIAAVDRPIEAWDDGREPRISYDATRSEVVVSAEAHTSLQLAVSVARAFTDGRLREAALPAADVDDLLADGAPALRLRRQLGWLSDDVTDGVEWWAELADARENLLDLTHDLRDADDSSPDLRGEILRLAHGITGTVVHALDRAGVDVVREIRLPTYRQFNTAKRAAIAETVAHGVTVQSAYGDYAFYRAVLESREEKRRTASSPRVDAADPYGEFIGGMTIVGPKADDLARRVRDRLADADPADDAPEIAARVPVDTDPGRPAVVAVVDRLAEAKNLTATRQATAVIDALLQDPYTAADALASLERADTRRAIRLDEVRYALAQLPADRLLPSVSAPSARAMLAALLRAEGPLTPGALAERADVSERSVERHTAALTALDVVRETDDGLRVALPGRDERGETVLPAPARETYTTATDALEAVAWAVLDADRRREATAAADPGDRLRALADDPDVGPWAPVATALGAATIEADPPDVDPPTVTVGPDPQQAALADAEVAA